MGVFSTRVVFKIVGVDAIRWRREEREDGVRASWCHRPSMNPLDHDSRHTSSAIAKYLHLESRNLCPLYWCHHTECSVQRGLPLGEAGIYTEALDYCRKTGRLRT